MYLSEIISPFFEHSVFGQVTKMLNKDLLPENALGLKQYDVRSKFLNKVQQIQIEIKFYTEL